MFKTLIKCADLSSLPVGMATIFAGAAAAAVNGNFEWISVSLCMLFMICFQITVNMAQRYSYALTHYGEHVDQYIIYSQREMQYSLTAILREGISGMGLLTLIFAITLFEMGGWHMFLLAVVIVAVIYFNSFGAWPLSRTPFNWVITTIFFGPVAVMSVTYIQACYHAVDALTWQDFGPAFYLGIVSGTFAANSLLIYNAICIKNDKHYGKHTVATMLGMRASQVLFIIIGLLDLAVVCYMNVVFDVVYGWCAVLVVIVAVIINTYIGIKMSKLQYDGYPRIRNLFNYTYLAMMILLFVIYILGGHPDVRPIYYV